MTRLSSFLLASCLALFAVAAPSPKTEKRDSSWWLANIDRQGTVAYGDSSYTIFRNVMDYGATGDGSTDDTAAINSAISDGSRCGEGCDSTTLTPALVYFPPGTYVVSTPLTQYYYTQLVGDAISPPTIKASASFTGMAVIDADPYEDSGANWFTNQNNFFRQVRNFVIDLTAMPVTSGAGIHWQVAQATSLQNIVFNMRTDGGDTNVQQGIFMDNGSGGFMTDLVFNGGKYGAFFGNQQFTTRNLTFNNCQTAIYMNWNWIWNLQGITISGSDVGIDMSSGGATAQAVGSVILMDSTISDTSVGIKTAWTSAEGANGTLIVDNVDMSSNVPVAIQSSTDSSTVLAGNQVISSFIQGREYIGANNGQTVQSTETAVTKPSTLLNSAGQVYTRSKPQYESYAASSFVSVKSNGAAGDGTTDDTAALQSIFDSVSTDDIVYFDHGAYLITSTLKVPANIKIVGEIWPLIMVGGSTTWQDESNPVAAFQVGEAGDTGNVEIQDIIFETVGPQPGAIIIEWNVAEESQGSAAMWDVHVRIGGSAGTDLQSDTCAYDPSQTSVNTACEAAFLLLHVTSEATIYLENDWFWVADHELDLAGHSNVTIYNGRGVLIESAAGPVWMWGTASEHSQLYNYALSNTKNVFMGVIQTETAYWESNPSGLEPFSYNAEFSDPNFSSFCGSDTDTCPKTFGLIIDDSSDIFIYGAGLYSFFDNYDQSCLDSATCQEWMVDINNSSAVYLYALSTKAATNMVRVDGVSAALDADNRDVFCATIALFEES